MHRLSFTARPTTCTRVYLSFFRSFVHSHSSKYCPAKRNNTNLYTHLIAPSRAAFPTSRPDRHPPRRATKRSAEERRTRRAATTPTRGAPNTHPHPTHDESRLIKSHTRPDAPGPSLRASADRRRHTTTTTSTSTSRDDADDDDHPFDRPRVDRGATDVDDDGTTTMDDDPRPRDAREARERDDETRGRGRGRGVVRRYERDDDGR